MTEDEKFFVMCMILQFFYLNGNQKYFQKEIEKELKASKVLSPLSISFLTTLCGNNPGFV